MREIHRQVDVATHFELSTPVVGESVWLRGIWQPGIIERGGVLSRHRGFLIRRPSPCLPRVEWSKKDDQKVENQVAMCAP